MNAEPTDRLLDRTLLQLRIALANVLTVTDAIRTFALLESISCQASTPNYRQRSVWCGIHARC
jgi:hypothetical protein